MAVGLAVVAYWLLGGAVESGELSGAGRGIAAGAVLIATLWLTEALPVAATALVPIALFPLLSGGELAVTDVTASYAHRFIYLFMGGFLIALAMQRWGLHERIALRILLAVGTQPSRLVLGFLLASAGLSMWISNTATAVMMLPIATSVVALMRRQRSASDVEGGLGSNFSLSLLLSVAYGASIGGTATLIGTPPNSLMASFLEDRYELEVGFAQWLPFGLVFVGLFLPVAWWLLVRWIFPLKLTELEGGRELIARQLHALGRMSVAERRVAVVFVLTALSWILRTPLQSLEIAGARPLAALSDPGIAIIAALVLFLLPSRQEGQRRLLAWEQTVELPWGILVLFGGGLSLAASLRATGVDAFIGSRLSALGNLPPVLLIVVVIMVVILLTELTSNLATTATFLPIVAATAEQIGIDPLLFVVPATLAASCAFMMPVATPPNAIVFGSGEITIPQMVRAGVWLNLAAFVLILIVVFVAGPPLLGLEL